MWRYIIQWYNSELIPTNLFIVQHKLSASAGPDQDKLHKLPLKPFHTKLRSPVSPVSAVSVQQYNLFRTVHKNVLDQGESRQRYYEWDCGVSSIIPWFDQFNHNIRVTASTSLLPAKWKLVDDWTITRNFAAHSYSVADIRPGWVSMILITD